MGPEHQVTGPSIHAQPSVDHALHCHKRAVCGEFLSRRDEVLTRGLRRRASCAPWVARVQTARRRAARSTRRHFTAAGRREGSGELEAQPSARGVLHLVHSPFKAVGAPLVGVAFVVGFAGGRRGWIQAGRRSDRSPRAPFLVELTLQLAPADRPVAHSLVTRSSGGGTPLGIARQDGRNRLRASTGDCLVCTLRALADARPLGHRLACSVTPDLRELQECARF
mmetsp:Transcript_10985/g.45543  ORF Transcript_10985/g.45543 Transcript_10985/m.45543 type:complete len:224 (-) Transcript_10985:6564-7235(-)